MPVWASLPTYALETLPALVGSKKRGCPFPIRALVLTLARLKPPPRVPVFKCSASAPHPRWVSSQAACRSLARLFDVDVDLPPLHCAWWRLRWQMGGFEVAGV